MKYLLTGGSGFLGKIILTTLNEHQTHTLGRSSQNHIQTDLGFEIPNLTEHYEQVIHCAGKAHIVPKSEGEIAEFFQTNHQGTINLLKALKNNLPKRLILISTVAVYGKETGTAIDETHPLNGTTPYALSKIRAEEEVVRWGQENKVSILILRLPLIVGANPPGNLGKMISGIKSGKYLSINKGKARRSMVLASDVASLIEHSAFKNGIYNLTDGYHPSFRDIEKVICNDLKRKLPISLPIWLAVFIGKLGDLIPSSPINSATISKMSLDLTFDDQLAKQNLEWSANKAINYLKFT